jgi:hypothetical protein
LPILCLLNVHLLNCVYHFLGLQAKQKEEGSTAGSHVYHEHFRVWIYELYENIDVFCLFVVVFVFLQDHKQKKKRELLVASMSLPEATEEKWERGLMQQWRRKYDDRDKADRMGETLMKLCSAYREGQKFRHVTIN